MFKFVLLFSAVAALATSATLQFTPNEVKKIFEIVEKSVQVLQEDAEKRVLDIESGLAAVSEGARQHLIQLLEEANQEYFEAVEKVQEQHSHNNEAVTRCIEAVTEQLEHVDEALVSENVASVEKEAREILDRAADLISEAIEELERLRRAVDECEETSCADQLVADIEQLQTKIGDEVVEVLDQAHAIVEALEQQEWDFDLREYSSDVVVGFVLEVETCASI